jgi:hypothetical protein
MEIVNGYRCANCTDVDYAKRNIDPAHPKDGPFGIYAKDSPDSPAKAGDPAVVLGGALAGMDTSPREQPARAAPPARLDLSV